ncbi:putative GTP-binding protein OBGM, mitochondrial [Heracleum sosnowskyi]|uniref:GTP-binding protein OBGM, mitochondrial n=1 Tax=Heracleum sosnowskyi TaxID=360622 RepID=A0AAD8J0C1_9APIA|nr:putative GTP-binding protein OBGM, mitochondrial [Heracleum sosnowskyi]
MWVNCRRNLQYLQNIRTFSKSPWLMQMCSFSSFKKTKNDPLQDRRMIDRFRLSAKGGDGGNGCYSIRRSRADRRGKADGANGGRGGDVILECSPSLWDFSSLKHHINAQRGGNGASKNMIGSRGPDKVVLVPVGTVIHLVDGEIPVVVEKNSSPELDPWDIPGTVDVNPETTKQASKNASNLLVGETKYNNSLVNSANRNKASRAPSAESLSVFPDYSNKNGVPAEDSKSCDEDSERDLETLGSGTEPDTVGDDMSETDLADDMDEEDDLGEDMEEEDQVEYDVAELTEPGQQIIIARGGTGGLGNLCYPKAFKNPKLVKLGERKNKGVDDVVSEDNENSPLSVGTPGSQAVLLLELKSIADVGLVGMPNAGKSTLLGSLSRAKPLVGHYAFTTLRPNLGNVNYVDFSVIVADIPGIIKGAHENRGLGHAFLRHIERTKVLTYVLDLAAALDGRKGVHPWEQLKDLILELEFHREGLSSRPSIIVANKIDELGADKVYEELKRRVPGVPIFPICAVLDEGVEELRSSLRKLVIGEESHRLHLDNIELN